MNPKVSICIVTYNHEKYIRQCLESVVRQQVNCEFEIIVSDDCSTDKTRDIIAEFYAAYPEKIRPIYLEKNVGAYENFLLSHQLAQGEYVCHCDGDDYFLAGKLQAQVDVLDDDPTCTAVWHRVDFFDDAGNFCSGETANLASFSQGMVTFDRAIRLGFIGMHSSLMYRRSAQKYPQPSGTKVLDLFRTWDVLSSGTGRILSDVLGRYRVNATGSITASSQSQVRRLSISHARFFYKKFPSMRKDFFIFAISNFIIDVKNLRPSAVDFLLFSIECFSLSSVFEIVQNIQEMLQIQVDFKPNN